VQKILGHQSILTTARYTHLTDTTTGAANDRIESLMNGYKLTWGHVQ
jgi:site-specific recombinase XerD